MLNWRTIKSIFAQLESALASGSSQPLEKAERDLEKQKIKSPYDSKIEKTNVELGSLNLC